MARVLLLLLCGMALPAQRPQRPPEDPLAAPLRAVATARQEGRFEDAAARRDEARQLIDRLPVDAPQFAGWAQSVSQLYQMGGRTAQARATLRAALDRVEALGAARDTRIQLLTAMADSWQQERNLLQAVTYLEKAAAAWEAPQVPATSTATAPRAIQVSQTFSRLQRFPMSNSGIYQRLAELDRQLGRTDAAAIVVEKWKRLAATNRDTSLASYFEQQGQVEEAAAVYRDALNLSTNPLESAGLLQNLAGLYERNGRIGDAIAVLQQATARLDASPDTRYQATSARQSLARVLQQSGHVAQADAIYQDLLAATGPDQAFQLFQNYAAYLVSTQRAGQATALLQQFEANHPSLQPWELSSLSNTANMAGDEKLAERYQSMAIAKQPKPPSEPPSRVLVQGLFEKAQAALNARKLDEAFALTSEAIDLAPRAADREQAAWHVPALAAGLAGQKAAVQADQIYQRVFALVESWSPDTLQPLLTVSQNYPHFLMEQHRWAEVPAAIERHRSLLILAHGAETGTLEDPLHTAIDFETGRGSPRLALLPAQDLLALEEALSGTTSVPYVGALRTVAQVYESYGDREQAGFTRRRMIEIADRIYPAKAIDRASLRMELAFPLAAQGQYDEAERLAGEAAAITRDGPSGVPFAQSLEQIRQMRAASLKGGVPIVQRDFIVSRVPGQWFSGATVVMQSDGSVVGTPVRH